MTAKTQTSRTLVEGSVQWSAVASRKSDIPGQITQSPGVGHQSCVIRHQAVRVALLTGGGDKPYALGMAAALTSEGISVDFIGSDDLNVPEVVTDPRINFLNLRGDQRSEASSMAKSVQGIKVLLPAYWLCGHGKTKTLSPAVE